MAHKSGAFDRVWLLLLSLICAALCLTAFHRLRPAAARSLSAASQQPEETYLPYVPRSAVDSPFEFVAGIGGSIRASAISGTLAYVGEGAAMAVLEVGDPAAPTRLARLELPDLVNGLQKVNEIVYLATEQGLAVVDVQDPVNPRALSYFPVSTGAAAIYIDGPHAFLAARESGLVILDVSDPPRPAFRGVYPEPTYKVWVENDLAFVIVGSYSTGDGDLKILDVSDPENPLAIGAFEDQAVRDIQVVNDLAYVSALGKLTVLDVTDPTNPTVQSSLGGTGQVLSLWISDGSAYLLTAVFGFSISCEFWVVDVSNPSQLLPVGSLTPFTRSSNCHGDIQNAENTVYISRGAFYSLDVSIPETPSERGVYSLMPRYMQVVGPLVYVADEDSGLNILEVSDPLHPVYLSRYQAEGSIWGVHVSENRAYLSTVKPGRFGGGSFQVLDVMDPSNPALLGSLSVFARPDMDIEGDRAYLRKVQVGLGVPLTVVDVSDPLSPTEILTYWPVPYNLYSLDALGHTAYLGLYRVSIPEGGELRILDTSDPSNPIVQGSVPISRSVDLAVAGSLVFSASPEAGLQIVDASDPSHPVLISTFEVLGAAASVHPVRSAVYLADGDLQWIDLTDPFNPVLIDTFPTIGATASVQAVGDRVYVADAEAGIQVLQPR